MAPSCSSMTQEYERIRLPLPPGRIDVQILHGILCIYDILYYYYYYMCIDAYNIGRSLGARGPKTIPESSGL